MIIEKGAKEKNYHTHILYYNSAREAFGDIIDMTGITFNDSILLPGYIGFSPFEGSGIFDPIVSRGINPAFYRIDRNLNIDIDDFMEQLSKSNIKLVLFVHYFGYVDPNLEMMVDICKERGIFVLEDCAHALFTDFVDNKCGYYGDASIYSLHKMFPIAYGGMLKVKCGIDVSKAIGRENTVKELIPLNYDLHTISNIRKRNCKNMIQELHDFGNEISFLRSEKECMECTPQTLPIIIKNADRYKLYQILNERGFGVVSLYHTMIEPLRNRNHDDALWLSARILNLPIHQDVTHEQIGQFVHEFKNAIELSK